MSPLVSAYSRTEAHQLNEQGPSKGLFLENWFLYTE
jgi:hypothetical protein